MTLRRIPLEPQLYDLTVGLRQTVLFQNKENLFLLNTEIGLGV